MEEILNKLKDQGVLGAILSFDGEIIHSNISIETAPILSSISAITDAIFRKSDSKLEVIEMTFSDNTVVLIPAKSFLLCAFLKDKSKKSLVIEQMKNV